MALQIEPPRPDDAQTVIALLEQGQLLTEDLPAGLPDFVIAREDKTTVGVAGLDRFGSVGLLRSVAVHPAHQGKGVAAKLVGQLLATADAAQLRELYLITTADRYGFAPVDRQEVPQAIQETRQFSPLCPSSAVVRKRTSNQQPA
ncbi:arsenic resistance N-acetyltransferase ArsN2 [Larkinella insperata]|uniref:Arsenic resistance N-acetyltransferase ArsN2 n=1 Tax=Larkinella insperata TaxID=332158 RepID=A0ABW3QJN5_9BACT